jgi:predicted nuclease of restriction endonuclease-like (RecB) superfamily
VESIALADQALSRSASAFVSISLTLRNWLIGLYISEYELRGADRAKYGERLLPLLSQRLQARKVSNAGRRQLYQYLAFYRTYPEIVRSPSAQSALPGIWLPGESKKVRSPSAQSGAAAEVLVRKLSYSHFELLVGIEDRLKRDFYEVECLRGSWSVRALRRQIGSLYFERSGLSEDKEKLARLAQRGAEPFDPATVIRDPYVFEFLGLFPRHVMEESDLEAALLANLKEFLLELGDGFCFEAQQKCIPLGRHKGFVDLVFYHRILKCHVLVELKVDEFTHENIGQLSTYVTYYRKNMMSEGDNPPVGLLLCTDKDHALVEYALAGIDNRLFVSKYQLELPKKTELEKFLSQKRRELEG